MSKLLERKAHRPVLLPSGPTRQAPSVKTASIDRTEPAKPVPRKRYPLSTHSTVLSQYLNEHHMVDAKAPLVQAKQDEKEKGVVIVPDEATVMLYREVLGFTEVPIRFGAQVLVAWTSATTQGSSYIWSPLASAQFTAFSALFSQYTIDKITFDWQFPWTSTAAVVATFMVAQDPDTVSVSLTETEIINFPGYEAIYPATGAGSSGGHVTRTVVPRTLLVSSLPASSISLYGAWSPVGSAWPGQTISIARNINATAPGTEMFARVNQVWHVRFRNRFA